MTEERKKNTLKLVCLTIIIVILSAIMIFNTVKLCFQAAYPIKYTSLVEKAAVQYDLDEALLYSLIETESGFDKNAVSKVGAKGLTQIMPDTFKWLQSKKHESLPDEKIFEPEVSIDYGAFLLNYLLDEFDGNVEVSLAAYHAGINKVNQWLQDPRISKDGKTLDEIPFKDTKAYVKKVLKTRDKYLKLYKLENKLEEDKNVNS